MNTGLHTLLFVRLFGLLARAIIVAVLLLMPLASPAQTFFGSGGSTNTAPYVSNLAFGYGALYSNTMGYSNTAIGGYALYSNTTGTSNTANGYFALYYNTMGASNTANGSAALYSNNTGNNNTANGFAALYANTTGYNNTANGSFALNDNTTGEFNTANGYYTLYSNTTGAYNIANGSSALDSNTTGNYNTANGYAALANNTTGSQNTADGFYTLYNATTGSGNFALGFGAGRLITTGSNNLDIGNTGTATDTGIIRIGTASLHSATYIAGISGVTASGGVAVYINANGQLGTLTSSRRFKHDIKDMGTVSDKLMQLRPVTFRYKDSAEKGPHALQYGLIAEEVAKVYPNLVQYDKQGKPFTIYYHLLTPMLLNELQKEHRQNVVQKSEIVAMKAAHHTEITALMAAQKADVTALKAELAALRQSQEQQLKVLAKLTAFVQTAQNKEPVRNAALVQH
jgi:trimeric autotransporter adhesin